MSDDARGAGVRGMINEMVNTFSKKLALIEHAVTL
jgi:hypothetical protein